jgi:cytochrome b561
VSQAFHWATAALVLATFALAMWPELMKGSAALHRSLGLAVLFLVPLRLAWRSTAGTGGGGGGGAGAEASRTAALAAAAATAMHGLLYAALLAVPMLGWLHLNLKGIGANLFGLPLPVLTGMDRDLASLVLQAKGWIAYGMLGAVGLHAAAALAHHYLVRDGVFAAMLPRVRQGPEPALGQDEAMWAEGSKLLPRGALVRRAP